MAVIEKETAEAIRKNKHLLKIISQERIWEEFKKAHSQVKDYNDYLNLFTEFDMWGQVFPGSNINTDNIDTSSLNVSMANLFRNENPNRLRNKLVGDYKIDGSSADTIIFLLNFKNLTEENGHRMKEALDEKNRDVENVKLNDIQEWIRIENLGTLHQKFLQYRAKRLGDELIGSGWKQGPELGQEIRRRSIEGFKQFISKRSEDDSDRIIESVSQEYLIDFLNDFAFFISINLSNVVKMGNNDESTKELKSMMMRLRSPIMNGLNFFDIHKDLKKYIGPKYISALLLQIRNLLNYIEPRINKLVKDSDYKKSWITKIDDLKNRYRKIIS